MEDSEIVALYWHRQETAITETQRKYGAYCRTVAGRILPDRLDIQECENDTYFAAWNSIPPHKPSVLQTFLGKITRRIAIDRWRSLSAEKRGGGTVPLALEELSQCVPGGADPAEKLEAMELAEKINAFLEKLPPLERKVFLTRYFELASLKEICEKYVISESRLKSMLHRTREKLKRHLQKEGY